MRAEIFFPFYSQFGDVFCLVAWFRPKSVAISISQVTAKKKSNNQEKLNLYNDSDKQHAIKSAFFFADAANATTSGGGGGNDGVIPNTSEVFQMAFSMT